MPPPASRPHRRKTRLPPTTPRASAPGVLMMQSKARRSSRDATTPAACSDTLDVPRPPLPTTTAKDWRSESASSSSIPANRGDPPPRRRGFAWRRCRWRRREEDARRDSQWPRGDITKLPSPVLCQAVQRGPLYMCLFWREEDTEPAMAHLRRGKS
jgi:hypothetical protein